MDYLSIYSKYLQLQKKGKKYFALCPFHSESNPSFSINPETGLFYCFGCGTKGNLHQFLQAMKKQGVEIDEEDLATEKKNSSQKFQNFPKKEQQKQLDAKTLNELYAEKTFYHYIDFYGNLAYIKIRYEKPKQENIKSKTFIIEPVGAKLRLYNEYRLSEIKDDKSTEIWFAEGEKCCDAVEEVIEDEEYNAVVLGFINFKNEFDALPDEAKELFKNRKIKIFQDNDEVGKKKVEEAVEILKKYAYQIDIIPFKTKPEHYDIADFLEEGNSISDALMLAETVYIDPISFIECGVIPSMQPEEEWILEPLVPTKTIILLDGLGGLGKSIFTMEMSFAISTGKPFLLENITPVDKHPVLYLSAEETRYRFNERLKKIQEAYGVATDRFFWLSTLSETFKLNTSRIFRKENNQTTPTEVADFLDKAINRIGPKLVVLDSFVNFYGLDENKTEEAASFYDYIKQIIKKYGCSFIFLHHQTKEAMRGQVNIFRGSGVFREQARTRIVMCKKHGQRIVEIEKSNYYSELLEVFPVSIELHDGVWTVTGQKVVIEEEYDGNGKKKNRNTNRNNGKCINTVGDEKWLQMPADDF
jgi:DNA primase